MWAVGHAAASYLAATTLVWCYNAACSAKLLKNHTPIDLSARLLFCVVLCSNWPDFAHYGSLRILTHNGLAVLFAPAIGIILLNMALGPMRRLHLNQLGVVVVSSLCHGLCDTVFGTFHYLYPFSSKSLSVYLFNTPHDKAAEIALAIPFLVIFLVTGHRQRIAHFFCCSKHNSKGASGSATKAEKLVMWLYCVFLTLQYALFIRTNPECLTLNSRWYAWQFTVVFGLFYGVMASIPLHEVSCMLFQGR
ncbi:ferredoxin, mitochondrial [Pelomyxa schiedti]|nr:ferredoxin, mitochondrial [Pelomyxa schiedti]